MKRFKHTTGPEGPDTPRPNDCFVRAIAVATNTPYNKVYEFTNRLLERGLPMMAKAARSGHLGPVPQHALRQMERSNPRVDDDGVDSVLADFFLTRILGATRHEASCLCEVPNEGTFTVATHDHIFAVIDGVIHDAHVKGELVNNLNHDHEPIIAYYEIPKRKEDRMTYTFKVGDRTASYAKGQETGNRLFEMDLEMFQEIYDNVFPESIDNIDLSDWKEVA